jgi:hypothetical protein
MPVELHNYKTTWLLEGALMRMSQVPKVLEPSDDRADHATVTVRVAGCANVTGAATTVKAAVADVPSFAPVESSACATAVYEPAGTSAGKANVRDADFPS